MSTLLLASVSGSPGVTCTATAMAVHWPRPVLLIEADISNVGSLLTGFFRSNLTTRAGMQQVSLACSRDALDLDTLLNPDFGVSIPVHLLPPVPAAPIPTMPDGHRLWMIPGYRDLQIIDGVRTVWHRLPAVLAHAGEVGIDVIIDLGRLHRDDPRTVLLDAADQVLLLSASTMTDLNRLHHRLRGADLIDRIDHSRGTLYQSVLVHGPHEVVSPQAFAELTLPVLGTLPFDPDGAAVFALGREDRKPARNRFRRSVRTLLAALDERLHSTHPADMVVTG